MLSLLLCIFLAAPLPPTPTKIPVPYVQVQHAQAVYVRGQAQLSWEAPVPLCVSRSDGRALGCVRGQVVDTAPDFGLQYYLRYNDHTVAIVFLEARVYLPLTRR